MKYFQICLRKSANRAPGPDVMLGYHFWIDDNLLSVVLLHDAWKNKHSRKIKLLFVNKDNIWLW